MMIFQTPRSVLSTAVLLLSAGCLVVSPSTTSYIVAFTPSVVSRSKIINTAAAATPTTPSSLGRPLTVSATSSNDNEIIDGVVIDADNDHDGDSSSGTSTTTTITSVQSSDVEVIVSDADDTKSLNRDLLQKETFIRDGQQLIESMKDGLAKGQDGNDDGDDDKIVLMTVEMEALQKAIDDPTSSSSLLSQRIYELLIEKGMNYDLDPATGALTKTQFTDLSNLLDNRAVKNEFFRLYSFGMQAAMTGVLDTETVKQIVEERLVSRTGLSPTEFDAWLGF
jgi:hypothetical protein